MDIYVVVFFNHEKNSNRVLCVYVYFMHTWSSMFLEQTDVVPLRDEWHPTYMNEIVLY